MSEARKAAFDEFAVQAEKDGFFILNDALNQLLFAGGWNAHAEHTADLREKAAALVEVEQIILNGFSVLSTNDAKWFAQVKNRFAALKTALEKNK